MLLRIYDSARLLEGRRIHAWLPSVMYFWSKTVQHNIKCSLRISPIDQHFYKRPIWSIIGVYISPDHFDRCMGVSVPSEFMWLTIKAGIVWNTGHISGIFICLGLRITELVEITP